LLSVFDEVFRNESLENFLLGQCIVLCNFIINIFVKKKKEKEKKTQKGGGRGDFKNVIC
jgi:hypothetical protein